MTDALPVPDDSVVNSARQAALNARRTIIASTGLWFVPFGVLFMLEAPLAALNVPEEWWYVGFAAMAALCVWYRLRHLDWPEASLGSARFRQPRNYQPPALVARMLSVLGAHPRERNVFDEMSFLQGLMFGIFIGAAAVAAVLEPTRELRQEDKELLMGSLVACLFLAAAFFMFREFLRLRMWELLLFGVGLLAVAAIVPTLFLADAGRFAVCADGVELLAGAIMVIGGMALHLRWRSFVKASLRAAQE
jgi:hypothetical protein